MTLCFVQFQINAQTTDLLISEYGEGGGNNKFVEIYNGTGAPVNLANYEIWRISNGGAWPEATISLAGMLANGAVYVVSNNAANAAIIGLSDLTSGTANWNGNDAVGLAKDIAGTFTLIDAVGTNGADPGAGWNVAGTTNGTANHTIIRKPNICSPNTNWVASAGTTIANSEWTVFATDYIGDLGSHTNTCVPCVLSMEPTVNSNTLVSSSIDCNLATISLNNGNGTNRIIVISTSPIIASPSDGINYAANTIFGSGETIAPGVFTIFNGVASSVDVTGLAPNTTYYVKSFEYNGIVSDCEENYLSSGSTEHDFTTITGCLTPQIVLAQIDACTAQEGIDEYVIIENGSSILNIDDMNVDYPNGESFCNSGCGTRTLGNNPAYITSLNTTAGCALFTYADPVPAGATIILFTGQTPSYVIDFSSQCPNTETFYAIFSNNANTAGRFGNSGSGIRTLSIDFGTSTDVVSYDRSNLSDNDGDVVYWAHDGTASYGNVGNCVYPLPIELVDLDVQKEGTTSLLNWATASERNALTFEVERFSSTHEFEKIGSVQAFGNSQEYRAYSFIDENPINGTNYYRLKMIDTDGSFKYSEVRSVTFDKELIEFYQVGNTISINQQVEFGRFAVYNSTGQLIQSGNIIKSNQFQLKETSTGIYIVHLSVDNEHQSKKLFLK